MYVKDGMRPAEDHVVRRLDINRQSISMQRDHHPNTQGTTGLHLN